MPLHEIVSEFVRILMVLIAVGAMIFCFFAGLLLVVESFGRQTDGMTWFWQRMLGTVLTTGAIGIYWLLPRI